MIGEGPSSFADRLRRLRAAAGLTQEALAERAGLTVDAIAALERGRRRRPYPRTVRALADALGLDAAGRAALVGQAIPSTGPAQARTPLPAPLGPLIGRERDLVELARALEAGEARPLTLIGPGGVGKTRLALAAAAAAAGSFPDGVVFAALAALDDPALVLPAIGQSLGLREAGEQPMATLVHRHLRDRRLLLVLDNVEHLLDAAGEVADLLAACPHLAILATSRAPLRLRGERGYQVRPLSPPSSAHPPTVAELRDNPAVRLFVARAVEVERAFALTQENAAAVAAICRRLDGLPLALELAAARLRLLAPAELLARLDRSLPLLVAGPRDLPARQRTMRAAIAWSEDLLSPGERRLFRRLAVFAGSWDLAAAGAVDADADPVGLLDRLAGLVEQSLVMVEEREEAGTRYRMLEPVREYARERLEDCEEGTARERHAAYFLALAETLEPVPWRADHAAALAALDRDHDNLRAALRWSLGAGAAEWALRLAVALWRFWSVRGHVQEGRRWLAAALGAGRDQPAALRARALNGAGALAQIAGATAEAIAHFEERLALVRGLDDRAQTPGCLANLGFTLAGQGDFARAEPLLREALALYRAEDDRWGEALALRNLGHLHFYRGAPAAAVPPLEAAAAAFRALGSAWGRYESLQLLGDAALEIGDPAGARVRLAEALALARREGDRPAVADILESLARVAAGQGGGAPAASRAAGLFGAATALREATGAPPSPVERAFNERYVARAREQLAPAAFAGAWAAGRALSEEEAVTRALADDPRW